ncbi:MAG: hypothetical protein LKK36_06070 [Ewingella americana]|jgi:hypothetical protein|nr:hypothetical protein [Ewingella americana]MCI1676599.1 hypothetical protein [Ewingella americana]MCI1853811.1 hypothetical protein [Ewingella americana]MCI1859948.1 hypothetical protein [Ewingella americana]MCI2142276.1 hypothetical protein [Ewingella americana]MCI2163239.1 hypothetical protein [Ewingella americana]
MPNSNKDLKKDGYQPVDIEKGYQPKSGFTNNQTQTTPVKQPSPPPKKP